MVNGKVFMELVKVIGSDLKYKCVGKLGQQFVRTWRQEYIQLVNDWKVVDWRKWYVW